VAQIAASMREWGWTNPILVDEAGNIIAGHGRLLAARQLGYTDAPVMVAEGWSDAKRRAYVIADNKLAMNADWDMAALSAELLELNTGEFDLGLTGFSGQELEQILAWTPDGLRAGLTDPDAAPEVQERAVSVVGDLWVLGKHRLLCGDSTVATDVERVLGGVVPHLMVTDPPYGVEYDPKWRNESLGEGNRSVGTVKNDDRADWREVWALFPGEVAYVWHAGTKGHIVAASLQACEFQIRTQIVWAKQHFAIGRGHYHVQHEPCFYAVRNGKTGHWGGDRTQSTLWKINNGLSQGGPRKSEDALTGHGTQKPVECMRRPMQNNSSIGQAVYEPFCGSGTSIIAAEQIGRACHAIELSPNYVDVGVKRWQEFTGLKAVRESDGKEFG
jgi:DNA modification methylase